MILIRVAINHPYTEIVPLIIVLEFWVACFLPITVELCLMKNL